MRGRRVYAALGIIALTPAAAWAVPAFSGAEGWGAVTPGGRGGQVIHVTNLNDSGPGSFRAAVTASGPRTVVFDVSGQINLTSELSITNPYLTIAGQTAPGNGITIAGETTSLDTHDIVIRYLRFRRGATDANRRDDALGSDRTRGNIIIDHVSASWGLDENLSVYRNKLDQPIVPGGSTVLPARNITIQWSISSEALNPFDHAFGSTLGGAGVNFHHNLWASNTGRNPSISFSHFMDFRNNVLFNWQHRSVDGAGEEAHVNMINNYYKPGPATTSAQLQRRIVKPELRSGTIGFGKAGWWHVEGNHVVGNGTVTADNWAGGVQFDIPGMQQAWVRSLQPHTHVEFPDDPDDPYDDINGVPIPIPDLPTIATQSALDAYAAVLAGAGATLPGRDAVDLRVIQSVMTGIATAGPDGNGIIDSPADVGGYPAIPFVQRAANFDTDQDGMPDAWEIQHGLNPAIADNNGDFDDDGFTNLEEYLNDIGAFKAVQDIHWSAGNDRWARIENWNISFQPSRLDTVRLTSGNAAVDAVGQHAGRLYIGSETPSGAKVTLASGGVLKVHEMLRVHAGASVEFDSGALDLVGGAAVFDVAGDGSALLAELTEQIRSGRGDGSWDGSGIRSALAAADPARLGLGILRNGDLSNPWLTFGGEQVNEDAILIRLTFLGDADLDGDVDGIDVGAWAQNFTGELGGAGTMGWIHGDWDYDGDVDGIDVGLWAQNFTGELGQELSDLVVPWPTNHHAAELLQALGITLVPEPTAGLLTGAIVSALLARRRRA